MLESFYTFKYLILTPVLVVPVNVAGQTYMREWRAVVTAVRNFQVQ
jgi:hypothetical protein